MCAALSYFTYRQFHGFFVFFIIAHEFSYEVIILFIPLSLLGERVLILQDKLIEIGLFVIV